jgi:hypothetical protein
MNIAGLAFLVITWQQLLGDSASTLQTTITVIGAAMSLAVIIALYVSRKTQIQKFEADIADGKKWMPTEEEAKAEQAAEAAAEESSEEDLEKKESVGSEDVISESREDEKSQETVPESAVDEASDEDDIGED